MNNDGLILATDILVRARRPLAPSRPRVPQVHFFDTGESDSLLVVNGSRIFDLEHGLASHLRGAWEAGDAANVGLHLSNLGLDLPAFIDDAPIVSPPLRALSLAVAQKCNLACSYCYAQEGDFGGDAASMPLETAQVSIDTLFADTSPGDRVQVTFLGGEPLANRAVLRSATKYAAHLGRRCQVQTRFSITTNGTLVTPEDAMFFEEYAFSVTVSLDGIGPAHDELRPYKNGQGSYDRVLERIKPLLASQRTMQVSARVTVTPQNLALRETLDTLIDLGFHSVGFSPMLSSPTGRGEMAAVELETMLSEMIACGRVFEEALVAGRRYPFLNLVNALQEIHRGTHRPYPCGAGAGYLAVSASGELAACHRFVNDPTGMMGNLEHGVDHDLQNRWLDERHVHRHEPCRSCWARYLCGGGCHHEVIHRGRPACDYIRGWLHYVLQAYGRLLERCPAYFVGAVQPAE